MATVVEAASSTVAEADAIGCARFTKTARSRRRRLWLPRERMCDEALQKRKKRFRTRMKLRGRSFVFFPSKSSSLDLQSCTLHKTTGCRSFKGVLTPTKAVTLEHVLFNNIVRLYTPRNARRKVQRVFLLHSADVRTLSSGARPTGGGSAWWTS